VRFILSLLGGGLVVMSFNATPSFADNLWDACHKLGLDRGIRATQDTGTSARGSCTSACLAKSPSPQARRSRHRPAAIARPPARTLAARRSATTTSGNTPLLTVPSSQANTPPLAECIGRGIVLLALSYRQLKNRVGAEVGKGSPLRTKLTN